MVSNLLMHSGSESVIIESIYLCTRECMQNINVCVVKSIKACPQNGIGEIHIYLWCEKKQKLKMCTGNCFAPVQHEC